METHSNDEYTVLIGSSEEIRKEFETRIAEGYFFRYVEDPVFVPGRTYGLVISESESIDSDWEIEVINNDVANAISNAAYAGWDFNQIMTGIPAAMELAQAGSIDLSDAVDYIVKSTQVASELAAMCTC